MLLLLLLLLSLFSCLLGGVGAISIVGTASNAAARHGHIVRQPPLPLPVVHAVDVCSAIAIAIVDGVGVGACVSVRRDST